MRSLKLVCWIGGLALTAWLVGYAGVPAIGVVLRAAGWTGLLAISGFHLFATTLMGLACWRLRRVGRRRIFVWGRLLRDAGSEVLPLSQVGGYVLGARALIIHGISTAGAIASIVVDATLEFCAQIAYVALGVTLLISLLPDSNFVAPTLMGLGLAVSVAAVFVGVQGRGSDLLARSSARVVGKSLSGMLASASVAQLEIRQIYGLKHQLWLPFLLHFAAWILCGIEGWLALRLMGASLSLSVVLSIESLIYAARGAAFLVPNAAGVQEGAYVVVGTAFGLPPDLALGLSLLKRGRDLILGVPALVVWQLFEARRRVDVRSAAARAPHDESGAGRRSQSGCDCGP